MLISSKHNIVFVHETSNVFLEYFSEKIATSLPVYILWALYFQDEKSKTLQSSPFLSPLLYPAFLLPD